jgi:cellulose synthase/poly-beta-1,6-N-acetylglucosamine synthase-like glycosyltransferase
VRLQRSEFARWTDTGLRRGWTSVLAGTGCAIRNSALKAIAMRDDRSGPWKYESQVEDFELTYRIRELGFHCHVSPTVRAYTDGMDNLRSLWNQRMKWQVGTVEDLLHIGFNPLTRIDWWQQAAGLAAAFVRFGWVSMTVLAIALHLFHFYPLWLLPTAVFILNDTRQSLRIPHRDRTDVVMAALLLPQEFFAWMRAAWFLAAWCEVLNTRLTGRKKDRWALQYEAEASRATN